MPGAPIQKGLRGKRPFWVAFAVATATSKVRRAVKAVNAVLGSLRLEKHPDKTFIGKIERGFDFLGYH